MVSDERIGLTSRYLDYLPAVLREEESAGGEDGLGRFLLAFEHVLTGLGNTDDPGLEELLEGIFDPASGEELRPGIHRYFDPLQAPGEFLDWLAGWVALVLRADVDEFTQRELIAKSMAHYQRRGTKAGMEELLSIYALSATIEEFEGYFQIGASSTIGVDTFLEGSAPHFFRVTVRIPRREALAEQHRLVTAIIDAEKPAHTHYELIMEVPALQIGVQSTVGVDTLIG